MTIKPMLPAETPRPMASQAAVCSDQAAHEMPLQMCLTRCYVSLDRDGNLVTAETIEPSRLQIIRHRLASGFYDRPEVLDHIAGGVARDL